MKTIFALVVLSCLTGCSFIAGGPDPVEVEFPSEGDTKTEDGLLVGHRSLNGSFDRIELISDWSPCLMIYPKSRGMNYGFTARSTLTLRGVGCQDGPPAKIRVYLKNDTAF